jgi:hypothetical protein
MTDDVRDLEPGDAEPEEDDHEPEQSDVPDVRTDPVPE